MIAYKKKFIWLAVMAALLEARYRTSSWMRVLVAAAASAPAAAVAPAPATAVEEGRLEAGAARV